MIKEKHADFFFSVFFFVESLIEKRNCVSGCSGYPFLFLVPQNKKDMSEKRDHLMPPVCGMKWEPLKNIY
ncbi:MAG: hypothetical protein JSS90_11020 [Bacteroidetes bacterium]|nr:hypothetical protein [Bacteroidota bacterium]